jgi:hypothetical protein
MDEPPKGKGRNISAFHRDGLESLLATKILGSLRRVTLVAIHLRLNGQDLSTWPKYR